MLVFSGAPGGAGPASTTMRLLSTTLAFIRLGRPLFLTGGFVLYGLGAAVAAVAGGPIAWGRYGLGQAAVTCLQLMTHYCNDYFDLEADLANTTPTRWSGGSRVLPAGALPRQVALWAALGLAGLGMGLALALGTDPDVGPLAVPLLALVLVLAWEYSAPPLRLHSTGWGELDTAVVVTGLVPLLGFYLQSPRGPGGGLLLLAIVPPACLQFAMLLAIGFPDAAGDARVGKRTLVVRLGPARAARLYAAVTVAAYLWLLPAVAVGLPLLVGLAAAAPAPVAVWRAHRMLRGDGRRPELHGSLAFWAVALLIVTSGAELAAFAALAWR